MPDIVKTCALLHAGLIYAGLMPIRIQYLLTNNTSKNNLIFLDLLIKLLLTILLIHTGYLYSQFDINNSVERYVHRFETILFHGWIIFVAISNLNIAKYREIFHKIQNADRNISKLNLKIDYYQIRKESYLLCILSLIRLLFYLIKTFDLSTVWPLTIKFYGLLQTQHLRLCWFLVQYQIWLYYWIVIKHLKLLNSFHWNGKKHQIIWFQRTYEDLNEIVERIHSVFKLPIGLIFCGDLTYSVFLIYRNMASSTLHNDYTLDKLFIPIFTTVSIVCCYDILDYGVSN